MVQLQADTSHGVVTLVGVAVAEGGLVATTANGLAGLHDIYMIGIDGRRFKASLLGIDGKSDLALISVPDDVPVAPFADDTALTLGSTDMTLSMVGPASGTLVLHGQEGSVTGIDTVIPSGWAKGMPQITSTAPAVSQEAGDPLLNQEGDVIGILYDSGPTSAFLPTQLVLGVADDLRSTGHVSHGWLGVEGVTASGFGGVRVAALMTGSPAIGLLHPGDIVMALGSVPIRSMADLRARLYVMAPDSRVGLSVAEGGTTHFVDVTLSASP
jgi:serine protease Do